MLIPVALPRTTGSTNDGTSAVAKPLCAIGMREDTGVVLVVEVPAGTDSGDVLRTLRPGESEQMQASGAKESVRRMTDRLLTIHEVAEYLAIPVGTLYQWRYKGLGPRGCRVGRHIRYRRSELEAWLDEVTDPLRTASPILRRGRLS